MLNDYSSHLEKIKAVAAYVFFLPFFSKKHDCFTHPEHAAINILIIRLDRFGDMVLTIPSILALKKQYPNAHITVLCSNNGAQILQQPCAEINACCCDTILVWKNVWDMHGGKSLGLRELFQIVKMLAKFRRKEYDIVLQPVPLGIWTLIALLFRAKTIIATIDKNLYLSKLLCKHVDITIKPEAHFFYQNMLCVSALGISSVSNCSFAVNELTVNESLKAIDLSNSIIINLSAGSEIRILPKSVTTELIKLISDKYSQYNIILIGTDSNIDNFGPESIVPYSNIYNMFNKTSINDLIYLFKNSPLFITPDTGTMHLAATTNIHIVAYFSSGSLARFAPITKNCTIIQHDLGCSGCRDNCFSDEMPKPCMAAITADELFDAVSNVLDAR